MKKLVIILAGGLAILAAGYFNRDEPNTGEAGDALATETQAEETSLFSGQIKAIEKAKGVEGNIMSAFQQRDAQMDAQGQ